MGRRPDPWLLDGALIVRADEAHALWPLIQRGIAEWSRMGATSRLEAVGDVLARWRALAELHDQQLTGSGGGSVVSGGVEDRSWSGRDVPAISTGAAADRLGCTDRWVRRLVERGEIIGHRGAGGCWNIDAASVEMYVRRRGAA